MFAPHAAEITIHRTEPPSDFDVEKAKVRIRSQFSKMAEEIVTNSWLKNPKVERRRNTEAKIRELVEFDERMKAVKSFVDLWAHWRNFYFDLGPVYPKNKQQLSLIENAIQFCQDNDFDLGMMVACVHRGYKKRRFKPGFDVIVKYGTEYYEQFQDEVVADIDLREYEDRADNR